MKLAFITNPQFMRRMNVSAATVLELDESLAAGDRLYDVVTGHECEVANRGFPPKRSAETADRLHWSREASVAFRGNCESCEGRLLFAGDVTGLQCLVMTGRIASKSGRIPLAVPVVGIARLTAYDSVAILLACDTVAARMLLLTKRDGGPPPTTVEFVCTSPTNEIIHVHVVGESTAEAPEAGRLLVWEETDAPAAMR